MTDPDLGAAALSGPEPLASHHELDGFDSAVAALDEWLSRRGRQNESEGASRTFVISSEGRVVGCYSLAAGSVMRNAATSRVRRNMPDPAPVVLLGRLAVDRAWQGKGFGSNLLRDAILRTLAAAEYIGVRAMLVHAISKDAKEFYERHGFRASPVEPMTLMITIDEAKRMLAG